MFYQMKQKGIMKQKEKEKEKKEEKKEEEEEIEVEEMEYEGVKYLRSVKGIVYDIETSEEIGRWDGKRVIAE